MALLILFGFVAGAGTALSPCVLPVLPVALSAGATGGRRRPLGIVVGLTRIVHVRDRRARLPDRRARPAGRPAAHARDRVLLAFGVTLLVPSLAARVEGALSAVAARLGARRPRRVPATASAPACWSGLARARLRAVRRADPRRRDHRLGGAAVHRRAARRRARLRARLGARAVRADARRPAARGPARAPRRARCRSATGAVMVIVALAMLGDYDLRFQTRDRQRPAGVPRQPDEGSRRAGSGTRRRRGARGRRRCAGARRRSRARRCGAADLGAAPDSRTRSAGSTPPAARPCAGSCAAASSWSTSGPTRASTASARCRT